MEEAFAAPDSQDTWQVGQVIHNVYEIKEILGEGGMGRVYRVYNRVMQKDLAVKRPLPTIFARSDGKEQFRHEAETWATLEEHQHIVRCYFIQIIASIPCIFVEYMAGGNLADWIKHEKRILYQGDPAQVVTSLLTLAIQMAQGLDYAHMQGLVHQDVKPANVLLDSQGSAKITDFGLAQARFLAGEVTRSNRAGVSGTVPGVGMMTREYASPEQVEGKPLTHHTDMWSWAVSVLDLFMGATARGYGPAAAEALENYLREGPTDPLLPPMPPGVVALLRQCFQRDPAARPTGMHEVVGELQAIFTEVKGIPYPHLVFQPTSSPAISLSLRAQSLQQLDKLEEALEVCEQALLLNPQHAATWVLKGTILLGLHRYREALAAHEQSLRIEPHNAQVWMRKGGALHALHCYEEALVAHKQAIHLDSQDAEAWATKGSTLRALKRYEEALVACEQALLLDPQYATTWASKCLILYDLNRYEEALVASEQALRLDPHMVEIWLSTAAMLHTLQRYEEALAACEQALCLRPQDVTAWMLKVVMLYQLNRYEEALVACEQTLRLEPQLANVWFVKGTTLYMLKRYKKALAAYGQALRLNPRRYLALLLPFVRLDG